MDNDGDDDDDDDLLSSPIVFKRPFRSRTSVIGERKTLAFMDACLEQELERAGRMQRIKDMIEREEVEDEIERRDGCVNVKIKEGAPNVLQTNLSNETNESTDRTKVYAGRGNDNDNQESDEGAASVRKKSKTTKLDINDPRYWTRVESFSYRSAETLNQKSKRWRHIQEQVEGYHDLLTSSKDDDDEPYDQRCPHIECASGEMDTDGDSDNEIFNERDDDEKANTKKMILRSKGNRKSPKNTISQQTLAEDYKRKAALANAAHTSLSTTLGVRRLILPVPANRTDWDFTSFTTTEALTTNTKHDEVNSSHSKRETFSSVQNALTSAHRSLPQPRNSEQRKEILNTTDRVVIQPLRTAIHADSLMAFLDTPGWFSSQFAREASGENIIIPKEIVVWLVRMACSSGFDQLSENEITVKPSAACRAAIEVIEQENVSLEKTVSFEHRDGTTTQCKNVEEDQSGYLFHICDLVPVFLVHKFGLWIGQGAPPKVLNVSTRSITTAEKRARLEPPLLCVNINGLRNALNIWATALKCDRVAWSTVIDTKDDNNGQQNFQEFWTENDGRHGTAAHIVVALIRIGLDPSSHSGRLLVEPITLILSEIIEHTSAEFKRNSPSWYDRFLEWARYTSLLVVDACSDLGGGEQGSADDDDKDGWLPLSLAVRTCSGRCVADGFVDTNRAILLAILAETAIQRCLGDMCTWNVQISKVVARRYLTSSDGSDQTMCWQAMAVAEAALVAIEMAGDDVMSDGPRLLAAIELVIVCIDAGVILTGDIEPSLDCSGGFYSSSAVADAVCTVFERLENMCSRLRRRITAVFVYPHLRRVKELLIRLSQYFKHSKEIMSEMANRRNNASNMVQKTLDGYGWTGD